MNYELCSPTTEHVRTLAANMRRMDIEECWAARHRKPLEAVELSIAASRDATVGLAHGEVVCMFGVATATATSAIGEPWLLGTDLVERYRIPFLRRNLQWVAQKRAEFVRLENYVLARNKTAKGWLAFLGAVIYPARPWGFELLPFNRFEL